MADGNITNWTGLLKIHEAENATGGRFSNYRVVGVTPPPDSSWTVTLELVSDGVTRTFGPVTRRTKTEAHQELSAQAMAALGNAPVNHVLQLKKWETEEGTVGRFVNFVLTDYDPTSDAPWTARLEVHSGEKVWELGPITRATKKECNQMLAKQAMEAIAE